MKVSELRKLLDAIDPDDIVVLSSDAEGNSFSEANGSSLSNFCDGEIGLREITASDREQGYTEEDLLDGKPAFMIFP